MTNKMNKTLIITGGYIDENFLKEWFTKENYSMIIAADRGLMVADRLNLPLDFIVGDFDSVSKEILQKYEKLSTPIQTFPREKDKTDTQIAIELALMHNPSSIDIIGATGSRMEHILANLHLLLLPLQLNVDASIIDAHNKIYLKTKRFHIKKDTQFGQFLSLLPFHEKVTGLTMKGFKYPLDRVTLDFDSTLCISNEIVEEEAMVDLVEGILIVIESRD